MTKRTKKLKKDKFYSDDQVEIWRFVKIIILIAIFIGGFYLIANFFTKDEKKAESSDTEQIEINYDKLIIGNMFNRPYDEYYVIIYDAKSNDSSLISAIISKYKEQSDSIKIYFADLNSPLNTKYYDAKNINITKDLNNLKVGDVTLLKITEGDIQSSFVTLESIRSELIK